MKGSIESRAKAVVAKFFGLPCSKVGLDDAFIDDLGADALDVVELIYALETEFEMRIPLKESETLPTARSVIAWLAEQRR